MKIYIDKDFKCSTSGGKGYTSVTTDFFNGKCKAFIEGYRFIPTGSEWTGPDGMVYIGEMITPWMDYNTLCGIQKVFDELSGV